MRGTNNLKHKLYEYNNNMYKFLMNIELYSGTVCHASDIGGNGRWTTMYIYSVCILYIDGKRSHKTVISRKYTFYCHLFNTFDNKKYVFFRHEK